jgi:DNA replication protein DnaC
MVVGSVGGDCWRRTMWRRWRNCTRWVAHGEASLLLGPPGVSETHLAIVLGRAAIHEGYSVLFVTAPALVAALAKAHPRAGPRNGSASSPGPSC